MGNSISINNPVCCNKTVAPIASAVCKHPLEYLVEQIYNSDINHDITNFVQQATAFLNSGIIVSNDAGLCCPDCVNKYAFYFLGSLSKFSTLATTFKFNTTSPSCKAPCCLNIYSDSTRNATYNALIKVKPECCDTNFTAEVSNIGQIINDPALFSTMGLIEFSTIGQSSSIGKLVSFISAKYTGITEAEWTTILTALFSTLGLVVKCFDCGIIIASTATFNTWAIANGYNDKTCS